MYVITGVSNNGVLQFGKINCFINCLNSWKFVLESCETVAFITRFWAYHVKLKPGKFFIADLDDLIDFHPIDGILTAGNTLCRLKYHVFK